MQKPQEILVEERVEEIGILVQSMRLNKAIETICSNARKLEVPSRNRDGWNKNNSFVRRSYSDKEVPMNVEYNQTTIVTSTPNINGWRKVEKKKGKKM